MKKHYSWLLICVIACQEAKPPANFDEKLFNSKLQIAKWLIDYNSALHVAQDEFIHLDNYNKYKPEGFCYQENNKWNAVFGINKDRSYMIIRHYLIESNKAVLLKKESESKSGYTNPLFRAILLTKAVMHDYQSRDFYAKMNSDSTCTVFCFPKFSGSRSKVSKSAGYQFIYDKSASFVVKKEAYNDYDEVVIHPDELILNYSKDTQLPLSGIFFAEYYKRYFQKISLQTKEMKSTLKNSSIESKWIHRSNAQ